MCPETAMISVKSKLKAEREKIGVTLEQISSDTHISLHHLESIEEGRFADLPGGMYNRAFIKAYCESIQLDPGEILERYEQETDLHSGKHSRTKDTVPRQTLSYSEFTLAKLKRLGNLWRKGPGVVSRNFLSYRAVSASPYTSQFCLIPLQFGFHY